MQYRFAEYVLDTVAETVIGPEGPVALRRRAYELLRVLLEHAPALVRRDTILDEVWGHDALSPNVLPQTVSEIRQALGDNAQSPRLIETHYRRGYRLLAPVEILAHAAAATNPTPTSAAAIVADAGVAGAGLPPANITSQPTPRRRWLWTAAACVLLVIGAVAWYGVRPNAGFNDKQTRPSLAIIAGTHAGGAAWIAGAGTELLTVALSGGDRVQLVRGDGRGVEDGVGNSRWQLWMREVLGADYAVTASWRSGEDGISLDYSLLRLSDGRVAHTGHLQNKDLATLCRDAARDLRRSLRVIDPGSAWLAELPGKPAARQAYYRGLAALANGEPGAATALLQQATADPQAGSRVRIALATAYGRSGRMVQARAEFASVLESAKGSLSVGERLRLESEAALVNDKPADAAASLRALHHLAPRDVEIALALTDAQIRARQPDAASTTLTSIRTLGAGPNEDPRWYLAQARVAALRNDNTARQAAASQALQLARRFSRQSLAVEAGIELAQAERAHGDLPAARNRLQAILAAGPPPGLLPRVRTQLGSLLRDMGKFGLAEKQLQAAQQLYTGNGNRAGQLRTQIELHIIESERGQSEPAYRKLLALEPDVLELDDPAVLGRFYNTLGVQATRNDHVDDANTYLQRAASQLRRANLPKQEAGAYTNLGNVLARNKRFDEARVIWEKALGVFRDSGDRLGAAITLGNLGALASIQGNSKRSRDLNRQALVLLREIGANQHIARTAFNLGLAIERDGDLPEAEQLFTESLQAYRAGKGGDPVLHVTAALARVQLALGKSAAVRKLLQSVETDFTTLDNPLSKSMVAAAWGHLESASGHVEASRSYHQQARKLREAAHREDWQAMSQLDLLMLDLQEGKPAEAARANAERIAERLASAGDTSGELQARIAESTALVRLKRKRQARDVIAHAMKLLAKSSNAGIERELERLQILATSAAPATRRASLEALANDAASVGFHTLAWRCQLDAFAETDISANIADRTALQGEITQRGLAGLLSPLP